MPVLEELAGDVPVSIDTAKAGVARRALGLGAVMVNDVTAFRGRSGPCRGRAPSTARTSASCTCRASRGRCSSSRATRTSPPRSPRSSRSGSRSRSAQGVREERICLDPGHRLRQDGRAQRRAPSRPRRAPRARAAGAGRLLAQELARQARRRSRREDGPARRERRCGVSAYERGASILRVHDVREHVEALAVATALAHDHRRARGLRLFGRHGVHVHEKEDGQDFVFDVDARRRRPRRVRPPRGRGRLQRRRDAPCRRSRMRARTTCSRRSRRRSPTSCCSASPPSAYVVRVAKPAVRPGGLEGTAGVSVSLP